MKTAKKLLTAALLSISGLSFAQTYCDSISFVSAYVTANTYAFDFYNASSLWFAYPHISLTLAQNPYLTGGTSYNTIFNASGNNTLTVLSFTIPPASQVPLNTLFTGTLVITDPNDASFVCTYPVSLTYGTMIASGIEDQSALYGISLFPNPATNKSTIQISTEVLSLAPQLIITDLTGKIMKQTAILSELTEVQLTELVAGIYVCSIVSEGRVLAVSKLIVE
jgi:Secretion system C-terminal sorting domain